MRSSASVLPRLAYSCFLTKEPGIPVPRDLRPEPLLKAFPDLAICDHRPLPAGTGCWTPPRHPVPFRWGGARPELSEHADLDRPGHPSLRNLRGAADPAARNLRWGRQCPKPAEAPDPSLPTLTQGLDGVIAKATQDLTVSLRLEGDPGALLLSFTKRSWDQPATPEAPGESARLLSFPPVLKWRKG